MASISWSGWFSELSHRLYSRGEGAVTLSCNAAAIRPSQGSDLVHVSLKSRGAQRFKPLKTPRR